MKSCPKLPSFIRSIPSIVIVLLLFIVADPAFGQFLKLRDYGDEQLGAIPYGAPVYDGTFLYGTTVEGGANGFGTVYKVEPDGDNYQVIHDFDGTNGSLPYAGLLLDGTTLFGLTYSGGPSQYGTIFKLNTNGSGFTKIFDFVNYVSTGAFPMTTLIANGSTLFGTTTTGGPSGGGTLFKINKDGTGHTILVAFNTTNGSLPQGNITSDGIYIYGTTQFGGTSTSGAAYRVKLDGSGYEKLHDFDNSSGAQPIGGLFLDGTILWGTTLTGGGSNLGTVFRMNTDGTGYQRLVDFNGSTGYAPKGTLISDGTYVYGLTSGGGANSNGSLFRIQVDGTNFLKLFDFSVSDNTAGPYPEGTLLLIGTSLYGTKSLGDFGRVGNVFKIDTDGANYNTIHPFETAGNNPIGALVTDGAFLYGTTYVGGKYNAGTIYKIKPDGSGFQRMFDFEGTTTGRRPRGGLTLIGTTLYGTTSESGANGGGTVFSIGTNGLGYTVLLDFDNTTTGSSPCGELAYDGTYLYGTANTGGANSEGTIYKILPNGTGFSIVVDFSADDGQRPLSGVIHNAGVLYGTTSFGGDAGGFGTVYRIDTDGGSFQLLAEFDYTNGSQPEGALCLEGGFLYGMTPIGAEHSFGNIYRVKTDGSVFESLLSFEEHDQTGVVAHAALISDGTYLYGLTASRGVDNKGTLFRIKPDGTGFDKLEDFNDGSDANCTLLLDGGFLYGTTSLGGIYDVGTLFKRSVTDYVSITNFVPNSGAHGTYVTIKGNDFDPVAANNVVKFNGEPATVISASVGEIVAMVPDAATDGSITVSANGGTDVSIQNFTITDAEMFNGIVKTCDALFTGISDDDPRQETFIPGTPGNKIRITFTFMDIEDALYIYDGPDETYPLVGTLDETVNNFQYTSTAPGGELTIVFESHDSGSDWEADIECVLAGSIVIDDQPETVETCANGTTTLSVSASGAPNLTYQWQIWNGSDWDDLINDAVYQDVTTATLKVNTVGDNGEGTYRCVVNGDGAAEQVTDEADLTLLSTPDAPGGGGLTEPECGPRVMELTATGGTDGQYRWYTVATGGTAINGAVNSKFTTPSVAVSTDYFAAITNGQCESARTAFTVSVKQCTAPVIATVESTTSIGGVVTIDLTPLISDAENDLDVSSLKIVEQPTSGAAASLSGLILTINYAGSSFAGTDEIGIEICDLQGLCATQHFTIEVAGDVVVYNAVSPNGDGKNDYLLIEFIDVLPSTKDNEVRIFNRWGSEVFSVSNYNNRENVFNGFNKNGNKLPSGTYYYKVTFASGAKELTGYLQLKD